MKARLSPGLIERLKKVNRRVRKSFKEKIEIFEKNPQDPQLRNHALKHEYAGFKSINITADYRAIYKELYSEDETIAYFSLLGTHEELYQTSTIKVDRNGEK